MVLAACLVAGPAGAVDPGLSFDQYATRTWTQNDGLPQNSILCIVQTPNGYMWLGTEGGLVRFDGVKLTTFDRTNQPALRSANITALGVDPAGVLWVGTNAGLYRMIGETLESIPLSTSAAAGSGGVTSLSFLGSDVIAGTDAGLFRSRNGSAQRLHIPGAQDQQVTATTVAGDHVLVGTPAGLFQVDGDALRNVTAERGLPFREVSSLYTLRDGSVMAGGRGQFARLGAAAAVYGAAEGVPPVSVAAFLEDRQGTVWVASDGGGLLRLAGQRLDRFATRDGVADDHVKSLLQDEQNGLWIGTAGGGLQRAFSGVAVTYGVLHGLSSTDVRSVYRARRGDLWVGTEGGGAFRSEGSAYVHDARISANTIYGFLEGEGEQIYAFCREQGVLVVPPNKAEAAVTLAGTEGLRVRSAILGPDGTPEWLGTHGHGLLRRQGARYVPAFPEVILPGALVFFVQKAGDEVLVGTRAGLFRINEAGARRDKGAIGADTSVLHRRVDSLGNEWISTSAGIVWRRGGEETVIDARAGLIDEQVYATAEQPVGTIWAATNRGVVRILRADAEAFASGRARDVSPRVFGLQDGFRSLESNAGSPSVLSDGPSSVWFGTTAGLTRLDAVRLQRTSSPPAPHLEDVAIDRVRQPTRAHLAYQSGRHDLSLVFTAFDYAAADSIRFQHRLEGLDNGWIDDGLRRDANYTDLRPGTYRFRIRACSIDGACADSKTPLTIVVEPRWFERRSVWATAIAAVLMAAWALGRARLRGLRERARELELRVNERTAELREAMKSIEAKDLLVRQDIEEAARFQAVALRMNLVTPALGTGLCSMPAALVGGDLVDAFELSDGHFRFFMADTTGHGVQAALRTMVLKTEYGGAKWNHEFPNQLLESVNEVLVINFTDLELRSTAICFDLVLAPNGSWEFRFSNAAAPEIFLHAGDSVSEIYEPGPFIGMMAGAKFQLRHRTLPAGARLVIFSDGLCEQDGTDGPFGYERIEAMVRGHAGTPQDLADALGQAVKAYSASPELADDVTILVVDLGRPAPV